MHRTSSLDFIALFSIVCTISPIRNAPSDHKFRTCSDVGACGKSATMAKTRVRGDSRGRSGAGKFLSNFEPKIKSASRPRGAQDACSYLQALSAACMDLDASISRVAFPSRCKVPNINILVQQVWRSVWLTEHTLCCLGSLIFLLASKSDRM